MFSDIKLTFDNKVVTVYDGDNLITRGTSPQHQRFAKNVIRKYDRNRYDLTESEVGHKKVFVLHDKRNDVSANDSQ